MLLEGDASLLAVCCPVCPSIARGKSSCLMHDHKYIQAPHPHMQACLQLETVLPEDHSMVAQRLVAQCSHAACKHACPVHLGKTWWRYFKRVIMA